MVQYLDKYKGKVLVKSYFIYSQPLTTFTESRWAQERPEQKPVYFFLNDIHIDIAWPNTDLPEQCEMFVALNSESVSRKHHWNLKFNDQRWLARQFWYDGGLEFRYMFSVWFDKISPY